MDPVSDGFKKIHPEILARWFSDFIGKKWDRVFKTFSSTYYKSIYLSPLGRVSKKDCIILNDFLVDYGVELSACAVVDCLWNAGVYRSFTISFDYVHRLCCKKLVGVYIYHIANAYVTSRGMLDGTLALFDTEFKRAGMESRWVIALKQNVIVVMKTYMYGQGAIDRISASFSFLPMTKDAFNHIALIKQGTDPDDLKGIESKMWNWQLNKSTSTKCWFKTIQKRCSDIVEGKKIMDPLQYDVEYDPQWILNDRNEDNGIEEPNHCRVCGNIVAAHDIDFMLS